jgi:hypothetical protein
MLNLRVRRACYRGSFTLQNVILYEERLQFLADTCMYVYMHVYTRTVPEKD